MAFAGLHESGIIILAPLFGFFCVGVPSFLLSFLGGYIIKHNVVAFRIGVLVSILWASFVFTFTGSSYHFNFYEFFGIGIVPVIAYWGILWIISGISNKTKGSPSVIIPEPQPEQENGDDQIGETFCIVECEKCCQKLRLPKQETMIIANCPKCNHKFKIMNGEMVNTDF